MLDAVKAEKIKMKIIGDVDIWKLTTNTYYDNGNNAVEVVLLECDKLVSEYQGRIYCDTIWDAFDENGNFRSEFEGVKLDKEMLDHIAKLFPKTTTSKEELFKTPPSQGGTIGR